MVTAGPTIEDLDPIRFISNRSSGRMGIAIARAAAKKRAEVILVHGPVQVRLPKSRRVRTISVRSAADMRKAVMQNLQHCDALIMAAAVADFTPVRVARQKIKKAGKATWVVRLRKTPDILAEVGRHPRRPFLVGFAAETDNLLAEARRKLREKNCDLMCANLVGSARGAMGGDYNQVALLWPDGRVERWPRMRKEVLAEKLIASLWPLICQHANREQRAR